jgi:hypothetical protein
VAVECLGVFLLMALVLTLGLFGLFSQTAARFERWNNALAAVAHRFSGSLTRGGWFSNPSLRMPYASTYARLSVYSLPGSTGRKCLEMIVQWNEVDVHMALVPRVTRRQIAVDLRNFQEVAVDWDDFRFRWNLWADHGEEARLLISSGVFAQLERLSHTPEPSETVVLVYPGWLVVRKVWDSTRTIDLERFVEMSLQLYDQFQLTKTDGIEFVAGDEPQIIDHASCRICGEEMNSEIVICRRCQTPHHRDCWDYNGGCATYGCRETLYLVPRRALLTGEERRPGRSREEQERSRNSQARSREENMPEDESPPGRPGKPR